MATLSWAAAELRGALGDPWSSQKIQFILMPWKCLCQHIYSFIVKKPISLCFLLLWEFIPPSDLQYKSAFLSEIDTECVKSSGPGTPFPQEG